MRIGGSIDGETAERPVTAGSAARDSVFQRQSKQLQARLYPELAAQQAGR